MALPAGVLTAAVSFGNGFDVMGENVPATLKIETFFGTPEAPGPERLVWAATGQAMLPIEASITAGSDEEIVRLPAVDQPGWLDQYGNGFSNWYYRATLRYLKGNVSSQIIRDFQVIMGQAVVDLDTMFQSGTGAPIVALRYPTRSVNGYEPDEDGNITIPLSGGEGGADAREVQLRNSGTAIEWRYVGDAAWTLIVSLAALVGPKGDDSTVPGAPGKSVQLRTTATEIQWALVGTTDWQTVATLASLKGADGAASTVAGPPGASAYAVWQAAGNTGTQADFLASLKGAKGDASTVKGDTGASAYQVWLANGNTGTESQFLASLKGAKGDSVKGDAGLSAYQVWLAAGNVGTEAQYLASLKGSQGLPGNFRLLAAGVTVPPADATPGTLIGTRTA